MSDNKNLFDNPEQEDIEQKPQIPAAEAEETDFAEFAAPYKTEDASGEEETLPNASDEPLSASEEDTAGDDEDDVSLPLSANRNWYDSLSDEDDDDAVSLPLSAAREDREALPQQPVLPREIVYKDLPQDNAISGRSLVVCLIMVAATFALFLINTYVPVLEAIAVPLLPIPLLLLAFRWGMKTGVIGSVLFLGLTLLVFGWQSALSFCLQYVIISMFLAYALRQEKSPLFCLGTTVLIAGLAALINIVLTILLSNMPITELFAQLETTFSELLASMLQGGATLQLPAGMTEEMYITQMTETFVTLLPRVMIVLSMIMAAVFYIFSAAILRRSAYNIPHLPRFTSWRIKWQLSWGVIIGLAAYLLGTFMDISALASLGMNLLVCFGFVCCIVGASFLVWTFQQGNFFSIFKILLCIGMVVLIRYGYGLIILMALAVLDAIFDLRGKMTKLLEKRNANRDDNY